MSNSRVYDEREAANLDEYYKETLNETKSHIFELKNPETAQICKKWIERLNSASNQRTLRNQYLGELYRRLKSGRIEGVFSRVPSKGPLPPIPHQHQSVTEPESSTDSSESAHIFNSSKNPGKYRQVARSKGPQHKHETDTSQDEKSSKTQFSLENKPSRVQLNICKQKIDDLTNVVKKLHKQNENLGRELAKRQSCGDCDELHHLRSVIKQKSSEINDWRSRLMKVQQTKKDLERCYEEIIQQCKNTMGDQFNKFKSKLLEEERKNDELQEEIHVLTKKVEKLTYEKEEELSSEQKHYEDLLEHKEREYNSKYKNLERINQELRDKNESNEKSISSLSNKIQELENKLQSKIEEENKLQTLLSEQYSTMKEEFTKIRNEMEAANQKQNETLTEKVSALKKCLLKAEKSKQKLILEYKQKIFEIVKNKEVEIKTLELQLQGQRTELSTCLSTEKQCELDSLLNMLEERYKGLLASTEAIADSQRQKYLQKMTILEDQLARLKSTLITDGTYV